MHRFIEDRLSLLGEFIKSGGFRGGDSFRLELSRIRFSLSKSPKEMKVPYLVGKDDLNTIEKAILELIYLMKKRLEKKESIGGDMKLSLDSIGVLRTLPERIYRIELFQEGTMEKRIAESVLIFTPLIDAGILYAWFGKKGKGRIFIEFLKKIYLKALEEEVRVEGKEPTAYLVHLALLNSIKGIKARLRNVTIKGVSYERLEYSVGLLLFFVMDAVIKDTLNNFVISHPLYNLQKTGFSIKSTLTPWSFLSIKDVITATSINPYYMTQELIQGFLPFLESIMDNLRDVDELVERVLVNAKEDKELADSVIKIDIIRRFRNCIFDYINRYTEHNVDIYKKIENAFRDERVLQKIIFDERFKIEWLKGIEKLKERFSSDEERLTILSPIESFLRPVKKGWFSGILRERLDDRVQKGVFIDTIQRFLVYRFDKEVERLLAPRKTILVDIRGELTEKDALREYEKGRVYLVSSDYRVILKELGKLKEGQLYIDMKAFTRKTFKVKEITMADFMKRHFYKPILEAAGKYAIGGQMMEDSMSIRLQNLLGDALIYSGDISSLVSLAENIQEIMDRYRSELETRLRSLNIGDPLEDVKRSYQTLKDELVRKKEAIKKGLKIGKEVEVDEAEWIELLDREEEIEMAFQEEVDEAKGREIEAGVFISYGTKAETIHIEDDLWGNKDVAIGEKINEASRGVNRDPLIRMNVENLLNEARKRFNNPHLSIPFDVYIDRIYNLKIEPKSVSIIDRAMVHRDISKTEELTKSFASRLFLDIRDTFNSGSLRASRYLTRTRDIYNKGHALSGEALEAFINDTRSYTQHCSRKVRVSELHPEIRENFLFLEDPIEFWFSIKRTDNKVFIFRKVGRLTFKGFESGGSTTVYEMLRRNSDFYKMIIEYHLNEWVSSSSVSLRLPVL